MPKSPSHSAERPPIVAVLGHVDHGKSTLLDFIRKSNIVAHEAGGITQHVAAYEVEHEHEGKKKRITFIDTPGHAAFSAIRARGANVADIAILVVAADDGVKAQTLEALKSIRDAGTPFIVAINKIDKPNASVERTQATLLENEVYLEHFGGDVPWVAISAKQGTGVPELLDLVLLLAEVENFTGDLDASASGYVIEARRDEKRGLAATLIITDGTLKNGMAVLAGRSVAPVRIMEDHTGKKLSSATFSTPVTLVGFDDLPEAGAEFTSFKTKKLAEEARPAPVRPAQTAARAEEGAEGPFLLPVIVRADVAGSLEAIAHELNGIGDEYKRLEVVQTGIGSIGETDVKTALAGATPAVILAFSVGIEPIAEALARERGIRIEFFDIIYKLTERAHELLEELSPKHKVEEVVGRAKVLKQFSARKEQTTIGGTVLEGLISRKTPLRIMRRDERVGEGVISSMQANRQDVDRVEIDREFGAVVESEAEVRAGDIIECIKTVMK